MTCEFSLDDGAYVLGALAPAERADFERHLGTCAVCREAVGSLAVLPGLLGRLEPGRAIALASGGGPAEPAPPTLLPRVLAAAAQQRRYTRRRSRRRRTALGAALSLTVLLLVAVVGVGVHMRDEQAPSSPAMSAMRPASQTWTPVSADVGIVPTPNGSMVVLTCWYASEYHNTWVLRVVVFPRDGGPAEPLGTWTAAAGEKVSMSGVTHLTPDQISRVELQRGDSTPLLWWSPA
jgi:Putative zinc-finger